MKPAQTSRLTVELKCLVVASMLLAGLVPATPAHAVRHKMERMAGWHETLIVMNELHPRAALLTYVEDRASHTDQYMLVRLLPHLEKAGSLEGPSQAGNLLVEDFPGGVDASFELGDVRIDVEFFPLPVGRETSAQDGAAVYTVKTTPPTPVVLQCGGGRVFTFHRPDRLLHKAGFEGGETTVEIDGSRAILSSTKQPHTVGIQSSGDLKIIEHEHDKSILAIRFEKGSGKALIAYGPDNESVQRILTDNGSSGREKVDAYYNELLTSRIETPEPVIDQAFRSAVYNLEYNWIRPFGWIECIHHWVSMFHMQHTGGVEWLDQIERSRLTTVSQAERLAADGHVPHLWPGGGTYRAFGGTNQFFTEQIRHYWKFTSDRSFIEKMGPVLDRVIAQTFKEYDPEGDLLLSWRAQIGNQEDYLHHPHNSSGPTIEGINMMRTRVMLARALDDTPTAEHYESLIGKAMTNLREELWDSELGRFIYYKDPTDLRHLDGQYQTFIYPLIWGIVDPLDAWTGMRHLRDRLMGFDGEIYCSNNFPNHVAGTWGMQAGASQQPWGAFGLSAAGLRNETFMPLRALSRWVMSESLRGSWPEISTEPTPAYFSPPAGVFVQSVVEALFGLRLDKPAGTLNISPSFPDSWPVANLHLPKYSASYQRKDNTLEYTVESAEPITRHLRWLLPPCKVKKVSVDGEPVKFVVASAVNCVRLEVDTPPSKKTNYKIEFTPINNFIEYPSSIAEGERLTVITKGCTIKAIDDRCGVLADHKSEGNRQLVATVQTGLLDPYLKFGRIGLLNFSRRTFFLHLDAGNGIEFWQPVDLTILPRFEVAPQGPLRLEESDAAVELLVRNNTSKPLHGPARLLAAQTQVPFEVDIAPRSQTTYDVRVPQNHLALLSPGDNGCEVVLPGSAKIGVTLTATDLFEAIPRLKAMAGKRLRQIDIPAELMADGADWHSFRKLHAYHHPPWAWNKNPMEGIAPGTRLTSPKLPTVPFETPQGKLVPISFRYGKPAVRINLGATAYKKLYLLVVPFLDSHNMFAPVANVTLERRDGRLIGKTLYFPGDLDWWCPKKVLGDFATLRLERPNRFGLLPQLSISDADWAEGKSDGRVSTNWPLGNDDFGFPQPEFWARCLPLETAGSVMSIIEIDLDQAVELNALTLATAGVEPALGLVAIVGETTGGMEELLGSALMPPGDRAEPLAIFLLDNTTAVDGWTFEGSAFGVGAIPHLFPAPSLNSLVRSGESATGKAISPDFILDENYSTLAYRLQGGSNSTNEGSGVLSIDLVDSKSGKCLSRHFVEGSHLLRLVTVNIKPAWKNRAVHLELIDDKSAAAYAWLGLREVSLIDR